MKRYNKSDAVKTLNTLGGNGRQFFFVIDFEMEKILISETANLDHTVQIQFPNFIHEIPACHSNIALDLLKSPISFEEYQQGFEMVMKEIKLGNTFLINLTQATDIYSSGNIKDIYHLATAKYKLWLQDEFTMFSPETFVKIIDGYIYTYPMKGTIDASKKNALSTILNDKKELAEHYTIVDLLRNDLSIVANQVKVLKFRYPDYITTHDKTLIQISSEIRGKLGPEYKSKIGDIIFGMLPAGSISGAPKKKTVEIIKEVEIQPRGYYTGICGYFDGEDLDSAVMIRYIEPTKNGLLYRSGGGITHQSDVVKEYDEMLQKIYIPEVPAEHITSTEPITKSA